jgi:hypothetical protein
VGGVALHHKDESGGTASLNFRQFWTHGPIFGITGQDLRREIRKIEPARHIRFYRTVDCVATLGLLVPGGGV